MKYQNITKGVFLSRPNRFVAEVTVEGKRETVHVKNTGRCRELLVEGATVYLEKRNDPTRKTPYDLVAVEKPTEKGILLVNMDSQAPNACAAEWLCGNLFAKDAILRREVTFGRSRFDFYIEEGAKRSFLEVKGVTLESSGVASFPDAPTERGVKHIEELIGAKKAGYEAYLLFLVQMKGMQVMRPNDETHKAFGDALRRAAEQGVVLLAYDCLVTPHSITVDSPVPLALDAHKD